MIITCYESKENKKEGRSWGVVIQSYLEDRWLDGCRLCEKYPRLYNLEGNKYVTVKERGWWIENSWVWVWGWSRVPRGRALGDFEELTDILSSVFPNNNCSDHLWWNLREDGNFSVKELATMIDVKMLEQNNSMEETKRNKLIPLKVEIFAWRAAMKRLPVREELDKRGLDLHSIRCPCCDDGVESVDHCLVLCKERGQFGSDYSNGGKLGLLTFLQSRTYTIM